MGKRFAIVIGVAAAGVMALGAQSAAAPNVVKYDTKVTIAVNPEPRGRIYRGQVRSKVTKCMEGRQVTLFKVQPGPNRVLGGMRTQLEGGPEDDTPRALWSVQVLATLHGNLYAKVHRKRGDGFVCRKVRSRIMTNQ